MQVLTDVLNMFFFYPETFAPDRDSPQLSKKKKKNLKKIALWRIIFFLKSHFSDLEE